MSILKNFSKYHSLGNDFIIFDWYKRPLLYIQNELHASTWKEFVISTCNRHHGVGADGVIIIINSPQAGMPEMLIFNADGSQAENCLNGLRCVALYMFTHYSFPKEFSIKLSERFIDCAIHISSNKDIGYDIITTVGKALYNGPRTLMLADNNTIEGHAVSIGNPHFIIFKQVSHEWLEEWGPLIESHKEFPFRTNVECVWKNESVQTENNVYHLLAYERGCGITQACSSGAAAVISLMHQQEIISLHQKVSFAMPGGTVDAWINGDNNIVLQSTAVCVYKGVFEDFFAQYQTKLYEQPRR